MHKLGGTPLRALKGTHIFKTHTFASIVESHHVSNQYKVFISNPPIHPLLIFLVDILFLIHRLHHHFFLILEN